MRRDDPFDEFFEELERMMNQMMTEGDRVERDGRPGGADVHLDVHEDGDTLRVVADMPGAEKDTIDLKCDGEVLSIDASGADRRYSDRVTLPRRVDEHSASASYNNGILEVEFSVTDDSTAIDLS